MDPATVGAALLAIADDASGQLGNQLLIAVREMIRQPVSPEGLEPGNLVPAVGTGLAELAAFEERPSDASASALAIALTTRAQADPGFRRALERWWRHAGEFSTNTRPVRNVVAGGRQHTLFQGRDFNGVTLSPITDGRPSQAQFKGLNNYQHHEDNLDFRSFGLRKSAG